MIFNLTDKDEIRFYLFSKITSESPSISFSLQLGQYKYDVNMKFDDYMRLYICTYGSDAFFDVFYEAMSEKLMDVIGSSYGDISLLSYN